MKKYQFLSFLKGAARACLTFAALSCVCLSLSSCGGGGGDEESTDVARAAKYFEGKTLELSNVPTPTCTIKFGDRVRGTGDLNADIQYGNGSINDGRVSILDAILDGEQVTHAEIQIITHDGSCTTERDFKLWWGQADGDDAIVIKGDAPIYVDFDFFSHGDANGSFYHFLVPEGGDAEEPDRLGGRATLTR